jgi:hypothetical protein
MSLSPFAAEHAAAVAGWTASAAEARLWCGRADFPMPPETVTAWAGSADVRAYVLREDGRPVAYGELWHDADEGEIGLARLIVDPAGGRIGLRYGAGGGSLRG